MNRQQRRLFRKRNAFETRYAEEIAQRQNDVDWNTMEAYMVSFALAMTDMGYNDAVINEAIQRMNSQMIRIYREDLTLADLKAELKEKTGIEFNGI